MIDDELRKLWWSVTNDPLTLTDVQRDMLDFKVMYSKDFTVEDAQRLGEWDGRKEPS